ncbi:MAG: hypothetical protein JNG88_04425 [Phycisphaerales bacterium]|nr:hypothetical protein [Phycisphaerales bacterium]
MSIRRATIVPFAVVWALGHAAAAHAADCAQTSVGITPLNDLGTGQYLGLYQGGLYPNGSNAMPPAHAAIGLTRAAQIRPLDPAGNPDPSGRYVLLSIGMSNTTQEFCGTADGQNCPSYSFVGQATADPRVNHSTLEIIDGAAGGQTAGTWDDPTDTNYDRVRDTRLAPAGLTEAQVQAVWVKVANAAPTDSLPDPNADAFTLLSQLGDILRTLQTRYPNVKLVFLSSRIYAGYASTSLNPEPFAFESGLACKWTVEAQIRQMAGGGIDPLASDLNLNTVAPWVAWGPYLWADGLTPRSDGLIWQCTDFNTDGTHPSVSGRQKVGTLLLQFFSSSPHTTPWFLRPGADSIGDMNCDDRLDNFDIDPFVLALTRPAEYEAQFPDCPRRNGDINGDGQLNNFDIDPFVRLLTQGN